MIEGAKLIGYDLHCDNCGEMCEEHFETFQDAVDYKKDKDNGWCSVKDINGDWNELCPVCNSPEVVRRLKGIEE